jgi:hypothetical protein
LLITIEGPDCGGKSTLTEQLIEAARQRGWTGHRVHKGPPAPDVDPFTEYESALDVEPQRGLIDADHHLVVMDRWHLGEAVYGPIWRGGSRLSGAGVSHVEAALDALGAVRVMCLPAFHELQARFLTCGDDLTKLDELPYIHGAYERFADHLDYIVITGTEDRRVALRGLLDVAWNRHVRALNVTHRGQRTYVGPLWPNFLLVGDERNHRPRPDLTRPFTPVNGAGCSQWLWEAIIETGYHTEVGLVNSNETDVDIRQLWRELDEPSVIALGSKASARLTMAGINHRTVQHPQYAKRFRHKDFDGYVASLKEAMHGDR